MVETLRDSLVEMNALLGRELGRSADGRPIFEWWNSEDMFWPAMRDGWTTQEVPIEIPLIGTGKTEIAIERKALPHYRRDRQVRAKNQWLMTKLLTPEQLIWGFQGEFGRSARHGEKAEPIPISLLARRWDELFPGADFPASGWRIPTDATLPRAPGGNREPNWPDTKYFIACVNEQTRMSFDARLADMDLAVDAAELSKTKQIEDGFRDCFGAFLDPAPGKRSNFVSFPWTKRDRA